MRTTNILELDFSHKLEIKINNQRPVILTDTELFIKEVRSGSIVVELIAQALPVVPLLWQGGSLLEWTDHARDVILWVSGKINNAPKDVSKQDLKQWHNILEPVAKDQGSQMNFSVSDGRKRYSSSD